MTMKQGAAAMVLTMAGILIGLFVGFTTGPEKGGRVVRSVSCYDMKDRPVHENSKKPGYCIVREARF